MGVVSVLLKVSVLARDGAGIRTWTVGYWILPFLYQRAFVYFRREMWCSAFPQTYLTMKAFSLPFQEHFMEFVFQMIHFEKHISCLVEVQRDLGELSKVRKQNSFIKLQVLIRIISRSSFIKKWSITFGKYLGVFCFVVKKVENQAESHLLL